MHRPLLLLAGFLLSLAAAAQPARITVDLNASQGPLRPVWAWFGYDEPNYTYMKDGRKLLTELAELSPAPVYVRTHCLLCTGDGEAALKWGSTNAYTEDAAGRPIYDWRIVDSIFDAYLQRGMKPLAQIGFMPEALSTHPTPYRHHWKPGDPYKDIATGWTYPPKDYDKWRELCYQWVRHCVEKYGRREVESWYWEVWNEPNSVFYWNGTQEEFFKLYDYAVDGVKRALPTARIGGLDVAGTRIPQAQDWMTKFLAHCATGTNYATGKIGSPLDAVLFHAKGQPRNLGGTVRMDMAPHLQDIATGFRTTAASPATKPLPIIIGESDPEGCAACGMATNPENAYRNGTLYASYTAASIAREYDLAAQTGVNFLGSVNWSFEFEDQPWFYGFRDLATNGVDKPVLNVFRMLGKMKGDRVQARSNRQYPLQLVVDSSIRGTQTDIGALATKADRQAAVLIWNYHDLDLLAPAEPIELDLTGIPASKATATVYLIDQTHSNSYTAWKKMGSPQSPTPAQVAALQKAGHLEKVSEQPVNVKANHARLPLSLERQGVMLVVLGW